MKKDDKIAKLLKQHGKQSPPSLDFTEMVMAQIKEETADELDLVRTLISKQKEELTQTPSLAFEKELFEKIARQNSKAKVSPVFAPKFLIGVIASILLLSTLYTLFIQSVDYQLFDYKNYFNLFQNMTSFFIIITAIIVGGGMYIFDYFLRERLSGNQKIYKLL